MNFKLTSYFRGYLKLEDKLSEYVSEAGQDNLEAIGKIVARLHCFLETITAAHELLDDISAFAKLSFWRVRVVHPATEIVFCIFCYGERDSGVSEYIAYSNIAEEIEHAENCIHLRLKNFKRIR